MCTSMHMYKYIFTKLKEDQNKMDLGGPFTILGKVRAQQQWLNLFGPLCVFSLQSQTWGSREKVKTLMFTSSCCPCLEEVEAYICWDQLGRQMTWLRNFVPWLCPLQKPCDACSCNSPATPLQLSIKWPCFLSHLAAFRGILGLPWPWTPAGLASPSVPSVRQF